MRRRPALFVLAGVNGAGKSSVGGHLLEREGLTWFNPDDFARELVLATG
jgi:predicted ABC-type ATPase